MSQTEYKRENIGKGNEKYIYQADQHTQVIVSEITYERWGSKGKKIVKEEELAQFFGYRAKISASIFIDTLEQRDKYLKTLVKGNRT